MIIGLGSDLADIRRIEKTLEKFGERFTHRIFTEGERKSQTAENSAPHLMRNFAAKEACAKALGTGLSNAVYWQDMEVVNLPSGKPTIKLTHGAERQLLKLIPDGMESHIHLTITDDMPYAQAFVIIEALPKGS